MSSTMSLGKVRCTPKGVWSATSAYDYLDILTYAGRSYIVCAEDGVPAGTSLDDTTYYQLLADVGAGGEILAATATIDNTYGTPTVEVVLGGTTHSRTFEFDFKHLLGNGIESIELYSTSGRTKTYRITYSNGGHFDFDVIDGSGISNIEKTGTSGLVDTYTITCQDGSTYTFTVTNGKSISTIAKTGTSGLVDTYTITYNDGSTDTFTVTNGQDYDLSVLAPDYDNTATYNVGDYANHGTGLYKCIYPITVAEEWNSAHWAGIILGEEIQNKANKTGYYDGMSVAGADNLITAKKETDTKPYNYRTTGGNVDVGSQENFKALVGGTLALNQLVQNGDFSNGGTNWAAPAGTTYENGIAKYTPAGGYYNFYQGNIPLVANHTYALFFKIKTQNSMSCNVNGQTVVSYLQGTGSWQNISSVFKIGDLVQNENRVRFVNNNSTGLSEVEITDVMLIDLTAMFGTIPQSVGGNSYNSIADYVYALGNTNGIAWLYKYFPILNGGYIPYSAPTLGSVCCDKSINTELNQEPKTPVRGANWVNGVYSTGYGHQYAAIDSKIRCLPNTEYEWNMPKLTATCAVYVVEFGANGNFLRTSSWNAVSGTSKYGKYTVSADCYYFAYFLYKSVDFTEDEVSEVCVCIRYDGEMDGVFEPYSPHIYDMGHDTLRGIYMLDSFGNLYLDPSKNDTKTPDGEITRRRGRVNLGGKTWVYNSTNGIFTTPAPSDMAKGSDGRTSTLICARYIPSANHGSLGGFTSNPDKTIAEHVPSDGHNLVIKDLAYTDGATLAAALNGVYLEYPLATATTESGTEYTELQKCHNWGTEELTDYEVEQGNRVVSIPVGHVTEYPVDLKAKLEASPDTPTQAGQYILGVDSSGASYIQYTDYGSRVTAVENGVSNLNSNAVRFDTAQTHTDAEKLQAQSNIGVDTTKGAVQAQLDEKAIPTGYYDEMGVGTADNLTTNLIETNDYPFNFAPTGGLGKVIEASNRLFLRKVIYGSVVVNQWINPETFAASKVSNGVTFTRNNDGSITANGKAEGGNATISSSTFTNKAGHVYLLCGCPKGGSENGYGLYYGGQDERGNGYIFPSNFTSSARAFTIRVDEGATVNNLKFWPKFIDITQWYSSTETADHIYAMETNHSGDGVNFFITQHPQASGYIPYNAGTLMSSKPSFHKTSGLNQFNKATITANKSISMGGTISDNSGVDISDYIRVEPSEDYYANWNGANNLYGAVCYDINKQPLTKGMFGSVFTYKVATTPSNCYYVRLNIPHANNLDDVMFFRHYDDTMNDVNEPYIAHYYPFDSTAEGHGIFKFKKVGGVLTDELYADGDELTPNGTFTQRLISINLGNDNWTYSSDSGYFYRYITNCKNQNANSIGLGICANYVMSTFGALYGGTAPDKSMALTNGADNSFVYIKDTSFNGDTAAFKTAMNGVYLYYEAKTATTSQKDPYTEEQACDNWGYEYYNDAEYDAGNRAVQIPVGNVIDYPINLKDKVESQPDLPSEDGSYLLTKNGSDYTYTKFASSLPSIPTEDGTYTLKTTISSGEATLNWVADA